MHVDVRRWIESRDENESRLFWVQAEAGMGKSAYAASLIFNLRISNQLLGVFFCRYGDKDRSDGENIVLSLAYQIAENYEEYQSRLIESIDKDDALRFKGDQDNFNKLFEYLIVKPLSKCIPSPTIKVIVIDALDEIGVQGSDDKNRRNILKWIASSVSRLPSWVKLLVTSRPETDIIKEFKVHKPKTIEANDKRHEDDLKKFIESQLKGKLSIESDLQKATEIMFEKSGKLFIYVAMVVENNFSGNRNDWTLDQLRQELPNGLSKVYKNNFDRMKESGEKLFNKYTKVLISFIAVSQEPLLKSDAHLLLNAITGESIRDEVIETMARQIHAMFPVRDERFIAYHKSVVDWLLKASDDQDRGFEIDETVHEYFIDQKKTHKQFTNALLKYIHEESKFKWKFSWEKSKYLYAHLLDHMDGCDEKEKSRRYLTSIPWMMKIIETRGVMSLVDDIQSRIKRTESGGLDESDELYYVSKTIKLSKTYLEV